jgi:RHS repeat-associated protein
MVYQWDRATETITDYIFLGSEMIVEAQVAMGNSSQNTNNTNVGYTGHQWDNDTGLNYMQARYYDPLLARFYSNDPAGYTGDITTFNRYSYVGNNPYKYTDPNGKNRILARMAGALKSPKLTGRQIARAVKNTLEAIGLIATAVDSSRSEPIRDGRDPDVPMESNDRTADDPLPRDKNGNLKPESSRPHAQLGTRKKGRKGKYPQGREFGENGDHIKDIDFTDHGRDHPNPHEHQIIPNETGGTPKRGPARPLNEEKT